MLEQVLEDFVPAEVKHCGLKATGGPVTTWLPAEIKADYDQLQIRTDKRFGKGARELLIAYVQAAKKKLKIEAC